MNKVHELYYAAVQADKAWSDELKRQFRWNSGDVRYTKLGEGKEGSLLNELYCAWQVARDAWALAVQERERALPK